MIFLSVSWIYACELGENDWYFYLQVKKTLGISQGFFLPQHNLITTRLTRRSLSDTLGEQYSLVVSKVLVGFLSHLTLLVILMGLDKSEA